MSFSNKISFSIIVPVLFSAVSEKIKSSVHSPEKNHLNILFLLADDLRANTIHALGNNEVITLNLDKLVLQDVQFTNAYSSYPIAYPIRASLMTGIYPVNTGVINWIPGQQAGRPSLIQNRSLSQPFDVKLDLDEVIIAEALKYKGYSTMVLGTWHLGADSVFWTENQ